MKAIHCIQYLPYIYLEDGGIVRFVLDLCKVLAEKGTKVTLLTLDAMDAPEEWKQSPGGNIPEIYEIGKDRKILGLLSKKQLAEVSNILFNADILHVHTPWTVSNIQLARLCQSNNCGYIVTPHGSLDNWSMAQKALKKKVYFYFFAKRFLLNASAIHYTADAERVQGEQLVLAKETCVIPCVFDTENYLHLPGTELAKETFPELSKQLPNILFLSRLHPKKGTDILLVAVASLKQRGIEVNALIAGPDDPSEKKYRDFLVSEVKRLNISGNIKFIGMVSGKVKHSLYQVADLFVLPTHQENFGLVLVEAMACETQVITSFGVDIWKEIKAGGAEIVENSAETIADTIERLLLEKQQLHRRGIKAREWVLDELAPAKVGQSYIDMYQTISKNNNYL